jgi:hypothetical protein
MECARPRKRITICSGLYICVHAYWEHYHCGLETLDCAGDTVHTTTLSTQFIILGGILVCSENGPGPSHVDGPRHRARSRLGNISPIAVEPTANSGMYLSVSHVHVSCFQSKGASPTDHTCKSGPISSGTRTATPTGSSCLRDARWVILVACSFPLVRCARLHWRNWGSRPLILQPRMRGLVYGLSFSRNFSGVCGLGYAIREKREIAECSVGEKDIVVTKAWTRRAISRLGTSLYCISLEAVCIDRVKC